MKTPRERPKTAATRETAATQVRKDQDTGERMYDVEPEDEKQRMKTPV